MLCMCSAIQRHLHEQDDAPGSAASLSVHAATAGMTRRHAAKFFYQICGKLLCTSNMEPLLVTTFNAFCACLYGFVHANAARVLFMPDGILVLLRNSLHSALQWQRH